MTGRSLAVRFLLRLYPAAWRKEYGEELHSLLLSQKITASVLSAMSCSTRCVRICGTAMHGRSALCSWSAGEASGSHGTRPSLYRLTPGRSFCASTSASFLMVAFAAGWWSMRGESVVRAETVAWLAIMNLTGGLLPNLAFLILAVTGIAEKLGIAAGGALPFIYRHSGAGEITTYPVVVLVGICGAIAAHAVKRSRAH